ncbi:cupin domain-containing protein [Burkholderia alba]|uniref:cupin domain-containing protein n=1 Tax=Burkholderia alba TaxID=2683677 RepID=UPI002B05FF11|nr:cupin domain-containing protein [Burkholderia alba]
MTKSLLSLLASVAFLAAVTPPSANAATPSNGITAKRDIVLQTRQSWDGNRYTLYPKGRPEITMLRLTIPPNSVLPWHTHPVISIGYVLSGTLTLRDRENGKTHVYQQGEGFAETVDIEHRGESGDTPTVLLLTYVGTPGVPTSVPAAGEKPEY